MADYNVKEIAYGGNSYKMYPANLTSETQLNNAAQDATETQDRVYPVRMDANGKLAVNVPWTDSGGSGPIEDIAKLKSDIGIVEDTDVATHAIASGQYVIWHGELYKASSAIAVDDALSVSNLTAVSGGGLNELKDFIITRSVPVNSQSYTKGTYKSVSIDLRYSGYKPVAVIGIDGDTTSILSIGDTEISNSGNSTVVIWNNFTADRTSAVNLTVLYIKDA